MDDLVEYLIALFQNDIIIQEIFAANGQPGVLEGGIGQRRELADYPKIVVWSIGVVQQYFGDGDPSQTSGKVKIEVVARQTSTCADAELCRQLITARIYQLIASTPVNPGLSGVQVSTQFKVGYFYQVAPTGEIPNIGDPKTVRWVGTFAASLNQNAIYNLVPPGSYAESIIDQLP